MRYLRGTFPFTLILFLLPVYVKCDLFHWQYVPISEENGYSEDLCIDNRNCGPGKHCIDNECRCIGEGDELYVGKTCYKEKNSGEECELHIQCPLFERCLNHTCQCDDGYIKTTWDGCQPIGLLDDLCFLDDQCVSPHTTCIDNRCKCSPGYEESIHDTCEPEFTTLKVYIISPDGELTDPHDDALHMVEKELNQYEVDGIDISRTKEITYKNPHLKTVRRKRSSIRGLSDRVISILNGITFPGSKGKPKVKPAPKLDQKCDQTPDCHVVKNAYCKNKACKCKWGFVKKTGNNRKCYTKTSTIGGACEFSEQCPYHSFCMNRQCTCKLNTIKVSSTLCAPVTKLGGYCNFLQQCQASDANTICSRGICQCNRNTVQYQPQCLETKGHRQACQHTVQCPNNQECNGVCLCRTGSIYVEHMGCLPKLNLEETCLSDQQCDAGVQDSECNSYNKCACNAGFVTIGNSCRPYSTLGKLCDISEQCSTTNAGCSAQGTCACNVDYHECNQQCLPAKELEEVCECKSQCRTLNSECSFNKCTCAAGYTECSSSCVPYKSVGEDCTCNYQCTLENSICYNGKKCWCKDGYIYSNGKCKSRARFCTTSGACISTDIFSKCEDGACKCSDTYTLNAQQHCQRDTVFLGGSCTLVKECQRNDRYSTCGGNGKCQCLPSFVNVGGSCMPKVSSVGSICSTCIECMRGNPKAECSDAGRCVCSELAGSKSDPSNANNCIPKECGATYSSVSSTVSIASPARSDGYYWNNADCTWKFQTTQTAFKIEILSFSTEFMKYPDVCLLDHVTITNNGLCEIDLCGEINTGTTIYIAGTSLEIHFYSNERFRKKGFEFEITPVDVATIPNNCVTPTRNTETVTWTQSGECRETAEDFYFESTFLRNTSPQWFSS